MRISNINARKIDNEHEKVTRNCVLCDCSSNSDNCPDMYELSSNVFRSNSVKEKPRVCMCVNCMIDIADLMI